MLWTNNPDIVRELHDERVRRAGLYTGRLGLRLVKMEAEAEAARHI